MRMIYTVLSLSLALLLSACSGGDSGSPAVKSTPVYDFASVDTELQTFIDDHSVFDGISVTLVDEEQGTVHEAAMGDHTLDIVVLLASTSKVPSVSLLMAIDVDEQLNYDVEASIDNYLPWNGVYGDRNSVHLVSNTAGIPGLSALGSYGSHLCQFSGATTLQACAETLFTVALNGSVAPGTAFSYGGTQWHLAGAVVENVTNSTWNQAFNHYIAQPCELEVFTYGNMWANLGDWTGFPDSLSGQQNAHVEGGGISNMRDYAKLLSMHLNDGRCGNTQVIPAAAVAYMQEDRSGAFSDTHYGMGWWIKPGDADNATVYYDPGAFGTVSWLDMERRIGGYVAIDDYSRQSASDVHALVLNTIIPAHQAAVDAAREAANAN